MNSVRVSLVAAMATALILTGCSSSESATSPADSPAASSAPGATATPEEIDLGALAASQASPGPSESADALQQWCNSYAFLSKTIAEAGSNPSATDTALRALTRFRQLWDLAANAELITTGESDANIRAVEAYTEVVKVIAAGGSESSPEYKAATENVTATTEKDHALLQSSAGKILGYCGPATAAPSPSAS